MDESVNARRERIAAQIFAAMLGSSHSAWDQGSDDLVHEALYHAGVFLKIAGTKAVEMQRGQQEPVHAKR